MKAKDVMTPSVVSVHPSLSVGEVAKLMLARGISGVPVIDAVGGLVGVVSEGDLMRRRELGTEKNRSWWLKVFATDDMLANDYVKARARTVADIMSQPAISVTEEAPIAEIVELLDRHRIKRVPVTRDGRVVGIVSRVNLLRAFASAPDRPLSPACDDNAIRESLLAELNGQPWWSGYLINIVVVDATVHLWGYIDSEQRRKAIRVAAENTPGVRGVTDHMTIKPNIPALA